MNSRWFKYCLFLGFLLFYGGLAAQPGLLPEELQKAVESPHLARILFYNCENLFDAQNDSLIDDEEFLPTGVRYWINSRFYEKANRVAKVITSVGGWQAPELVGLCEVENRKVLEFLTGKSLLYPVGYKIIHKESPDARGIDVALLYLPQKFEPLHTQFIPVVNPNSSRLTRDILYAKGLLPNSDTLHLFVNHWPSRYGGMLESEENRVFVASIVKKTVDSIFQANSDANIVLVGDFNDEPNNESLLKTLAAKPTFDSLSDTQLVNLSYALQFDKQQGSHKFQGHWGILDQIIVSGALLRGSNPTKTDMGKAVIFRAPFLLEPDDTYLGQKPFRTFNGFKYQGGFSDHLPVFLDLLENDSSGE